MKLSDVTVADIEGAGEGKGAMPPNTKILYKFEDKFLRSSKTSARSIVLYMFYSFTLKIVAPPVIATFKPGFHYPSSRPEFTGRVDGRPVSTSG